MLLSSMWVPTTVYTTPEMKTLLGILIRIGSNNKSRGVNDNFITSILVSDDFITSILVNDDFIMSILVNDDFIKSILVKNSTVNALIRRACGIL